MKKKSSLPITYPPITSYISIAHLLSVLWCRKEKIMPWIEGKGLTKLGYTEIPDFLKAKYTDTIFEVYDKLLAIAAEHCL